MLIPVHLTSLVRVSLTCKRHQGYEAKVPFVTSQKADFYNCVIQHTLSEKYGLKRMDFWGVHRQARDSCYCYKTLVK